MGAGGDKAYVLGHSDAELKRLSQQHTFLGDLTGDVLRRAGLRPGMKILDIGYGAGAVSMLAASFVGESGAVVGIDRAPEAIECAKQRARSAGLGQMQFISSEFDSFETGERFDALIGRFVLMYLADPAAVLRRLVRFVRPGGVVAFQEMEMRTVAAYPNVPLFTKCASWIISTFERAGFEAEMGAKLLTTFQAAGLPTPQMIAGARIEGGPDSPGYDYIAEAVRTLLPAAERLGVVSAKDVGIETLAARLREATVVASACLRFPLLVGAWSIVPD